MENNVFGSIGTGIYQGEIVAILVENITLGWLRDCTVKKILIRFPDGDYDVFDKDIIEKLYEDGGTLDWSDTNENVGERS